MRRVTTLLFIVLAGSCQKFDPTYPIGLTCGDVDPACPPGQSCLEGRCEPSGTTVDSPRGGDAARDAATCGPFCDARSIDSPVDSASYYAIPLASPGADLFYTAALTVGGTQFAMDLDTGSTTTGIVGTSCSTCSVSPTYSPGSTAIDQHETATTAFQDGSMWSGEIYKDTISLEHGSPSATFNIVDITQQSGFFEDNSYQGILGLGSPELAEPNTGAYFQTITDAGVPSLMGFELCANSGTMWLGGYDASHASGALQYTPLQATDEFYGIDVLQMTLGGTQIGSGTSTFDEPILDTGTSLLYVPTPVYTAAVSALRANAGFQSVFGSASLNGSGCFNQTTTKSDSEVDAALPMFAIMMPGEGGESVQFSVAPLASYLYDNGGGEFCMVLQDGGAASTFGVAFMQAFVTVIDVGNSRVGFAIDAGCGGPPRTPRDRAHRVHLPRPRAALHRTNSRVQ